MSRNDFQSPQPMLRNTYGIGAGQKRCNRILFNPIQSSGDSDHRSARRQGESVAAKSLFLEFV
jgi:hypothetical protein